MTHSIYWWNSGCLRISVPS